MAGLYDDLPEPSFVALVPPAEAEAAAIEEFVATLPSAQRPPLPPCSARSPLFTLDDATFHGGLLACLSVVEVGASLPRVCRALRWLRDSWASWRRAVEPLGGSMGAACGGRDPGPAVLVARLNNAASCSVERLARLSKTIGAAAAHGFGDFGRRRHARLLGGGGEHRYVYGGLPLQRVIWSLHSEGFTEWRGACSMTMDASFCVLPPWCSPSRRRLLPETVQVVVGISLWLPPHDASADESYPLLCLNAALEDPDSLLEVAERSTENPPCVALNVEAVLIRPPAAGGSSAAGTQASPDGCEFCEEWSLRAFFGPHGFRHSGLGHSEGYAVEAYAPGHRRWVPADPCFARDGEADTELHLLLRCTRCEGLLD